MLGVAMARAGFARRFGRGTTLVLAVASNLPDIDALWAWSGHGDAHLSRRLLTHSVPGLLILGALGATLFHWIYRHLAWRTLFGLCLLAMSVHVFFDLVNSYGVVLFYPFSRARFELAWIFIIDLILLGLLLLPVGLGPMLKRVLQPARLWQASLLGVALYVAVCGTARWQAVQILDRTMATEDIRPAMAYVFPEALGPHRFRGVVRESDGRYQVYLIHVLSGAAELRDQFDSDERHPAVQQARASDKGRKLDWFFQAPVWEVVAPGPQPDEDRLSGEVDGQFCVAYDLRFSSLVIDRGIPFLYKFHVRDGTAEPLGWQ
jgi:inner membrane protein